MLTRKITDLDLMMTPLADNLFIIETDNGTKAITYDKLSKPAIEEAVLRAAANLDHRNTYRGKNLGTYVTAEQKAAIQNGTFDGLFIGDFWVIAGIKWVIVDINYWYNCGDTPFTKNHLVIMPETALYNAQMNTTNTTEGGYVNSAMYKTNLANARSTVTAAFGDMLLTHRELLTNAVTNGKPSGGAWYDSNVELPNECMMYGHPHFSPTSDGSTIPYIYTNSKTQLALFRLRPELIVNRAFNQWLRDVVSAANFAFVNYSGYTDCCYASDSSGVRPVFPIG